MQTYSEELKEFLENHRYIDDVIESHSLRCVVSGEENVRTIVFMQGLEIQQMFMRYVEAFEDEYRTLIIEYPTDTKSNDEQISVIHSLIEKLNIKNPIIAGASDGGMQAQLYVRKYGDASALILMATVTLDSEYLELDRKRPWFTGVLTTAMKIMPWKMASRILTGKVNTYALEYIERAKNEERGLAACRRSYHEYDCQYGKGKAYQHGNAASYLRSAGLWYFRCY